MSIRYSLTTTVSCEWGNCQNKSVTTLITDRPELIRPGYLPKGWFKIDGEIRCPKHWQYPPETFKNLSHRRIRMSTRIKVTHWLICDWEDCKASVVTSYETSEGDTYKNIPPKGWKRIDGKDYCPKHWHTGEMFKDVIIPGPEEQKPKNA